VGEGVGVVGGRVVSIDIVVLLLEVHSWREGVGRVGHRVRGSRGRHSEGLAPGHAAPRDKGTGMSVGSALSVPPLIHKFIVTIKRLSPI
jgi:hypothetical protein